VREAPSAYTLARERSAAEGRARRGRVIDALRALAPGAWIDLTDLASRLDPPEPEAQLARVVERLVADGLVARDDTTRVRLAE
jgi:DNA-binding IclR family transcriptional regulator